MSATELHLQVHLALPAWLWWASCALAVFRLTRLAIADEITEPVREYIKRRGADKLGRRSRAYKHLAYFLTCPWCVGFWMAAATLALVTLWPIGAAYIVLVLAWSAATGLVSERSG